MPLEMGCPNSESPFEQCSRFGYPHCAPSQSFRETICAQTGSFLHGCALHPFRGCFTVPHGVPAWPQSRLGLAVYERYSNLSENILWATWPSPPVSWAERSASATRCICSTSSARSWRCSRHSSSKRVTRKPQHGRWFAGGHWWVAYGWLVWWVAWVVRGWSGWFRVVSGESEW